MSESHISVSQLDCHLSRLTVAAAHIKPTSSATVLKSHTPFSLKVSVEFSGPGAVALMPLSMVVQVEFYAKPLGPGNGIVLGKASVSTSPDVLTYTPELQLGSPLAIGLQVKTVYRIGAVLMVGAPDWPSFIHGVTEELSVEIYTG
jgi:hypothetical protein